MVGSTSTLSRFFVGVENLINFGRNHMAFVYRIPLSQARGRFIRVKQNITICTVTFKVLVEEEREGTSSCLTQHIFLREVYSSVL